MPIVTAADHRFARTLHQLLASAERHALPHSHTFTAFDLGLAQRDCDRLVQRFPWCRIEPFEFTAYPPHVRDLSNFAWKPALLWALVQRLEGPILWFDSATLFHGDLGPMIEGVKRDGVFSLAGQTALEDCCDPRILARLEVAPEDLRERYRAGGVLGFDPHRPWVRELVHRWSDLAADPECIAPAGLDPRVHRFDQAILTALLCRARREHGFRLRPEEIDISATSPVEWLSTRNKVAWWMPAALDPLVRAYYRAWKHADRVVLRMRTTRGTAHTTGHERVR